MYLLGIAELAIYSFVKGDFAMTRPRPLPELLQNINPAMAYVSGALLLISVLKKRQPWIVQIQSCKNGRRSCLNFN